MVAERTHGVLQRLGVADAASALAAPGLLHREQDRQREDVRDHADQHRHLQVDHAGDHAAGRDAEEAGDASDGTDAAADAREVVRLIDLGERVEEKGLGVSAAEGATAGPQDVGAEEQDEAAGKREEGKIPRPSMTAPTMNVSLRPKRSAKAPVGISVTTLMPQKTPSMTPTWVSVRSRKSVR